MNLIVLHDTADSAAWRDAEVFRDLAKMPEAPLAKGITDFLTGKGLKVFGPSHKGAMLEASKQFAKEFMYRHAIPTASFSILYSAAFAKEKIKENKCFFSTAMRKGLPAPTRCSCPIKSFKFFGRIFADILLIILSLFLAVNNIYIDYVFTAAISLLAFALILVVDDLDNPFRPGAWHLTTDGYVSLLKELKQEK